MRHKRFVFVSRALSSPIIYDDSRASVTRYYKGVLNAEKDKGRKTISSVDGYDKTLVADACDFLDMAGNSYIQDNELDVLWVYCPNFHEWVPLQPTPVGGEIRIKSEILQKCLHEIQRHASFWPSIITNNPEGLMFLGEGIKHGDGGEKKTIEAIFGSWGTYFKDMDACQQCNDEVPTLRSVEYKDAGCIAKAKKRYLIDLLDGGMLLISGETDSIESVTKNTIVTFVNGEISKDDPRIEVMTDAVFDRRRMVTAPMVKEKTIRDLKENYLSPDFFVKIRHQGGMESIKNVDDLVAFLESKDTSNIEDVREVEVVMMLLCFHINKPDNCPGKATNAK